MIAYADLASRTRRIWIIELTRTVCPGTKQHRIMHSRNPRRRYFFLSFFSSASFLLYFYPYSNKIVRGETGEAEKFLGIEILKNQKFFEKFFTRNFCTELNEKFIRFLEISRILNFKKKKFSNVILSPVYEYSINYLSFFFFFQTFKIRRRIIGGMLRNFFYEKFKKFYHSCVLRATDKRRGKTSIRKET